MTFVFVCTTYTLSSANPPVRYRPNVVDRTSRKIVKVTDVPQSVAMHDESVRALSAVACLPDSSSMLIAGRA